MSDLRELAQLSRGGVLRAAINTGNRALVQQDGAAYSGVSPALAHRLADAIDARMVPLVYEGAGRVFEDAARDQWDIAFLAIDPKRAAQVSFTRPYVAIEATFAVRADGPIKSLSQVDQPGLRLLVSEGSAYDLHLSRTLIAAQIDRVRTPPESFDAFRDGDWDAVAGVRASLEAAFGHDPGLCILPGSIAQVRQAMVLPGPQNTLIGALDAFVAQALAEGFVAAHWNT